ncbi:unnamed protein product, partial [Ectocarpus sp. 4 AP-2014]
EGEVSFKGGVRRMLDERRRRLSRESDTPSDASSTTDEDLDVQFIRVEKELKLKTKELELARVKDEPRLRKSGAWSISGPAAGAVPATGFSTDAPLMTGTAACATTVAAGAAVSSVPKSAAPVTGSADGAAPASGAAVLKKPKQGRGPYTKTPRITDEAEREGVKAMVKTIGEAFQRAKVRTEIRGKRDAVHHYMALASNQASRFYLVQDLVKNDAEFAPG